MIQSSLTVESAVASFGTSATAKLSRLVASGNPEDQLRAPFEQLLSDMAELSGQNNVIPIGESSVADLRLRPDYAVVVDHALVGFVELKAPGKGADPRQFTDVHDKEQGRKLRSLPNVLFTDGNSFSLWQEGKLVGKILTLSGNIENSGAKLAPPPGFQALFEAFLSWIPTPPESAKALARITARLCRFLRDDVVEQLGLKSPGLTALAMDWRKLLFPEANDERFADGYAQAVTFGFLMARAQGIILDETLQKAADELSHTSTLIGAALHLLTEDPENRKALDTSLRVLRRVLNEVEWNRITNGESDAWLYFYEDFLATYDNRLRKQTGSYYTPPEVVEGMVSLVDQALRSPRFNLHRGLASPSVTIADPSTGTGTFPLGILRRIARNVAVDEGPGAVPDGINAALQRIIAFEMQLGPFAVAQLRILAEVLDLTGSAATQSVRMFVTNTLGNPDDEEGQITGLIPRSIAKSRRDANRIKREETITVVIGNPPYKEKAKGKGGWVEGQTKDELRKAPLNTWRPPRSWGIGAHAKHLRNLYVYFWRWATWKVFDPNPFKLHSSPGEGIVCFITVAGFLNGPGFEKMRDYLRRTCDDIWVVDCSPEGHRPKVNTRIFQAVQQPVCIVMASRSSAKNSNIPAAVHFRSLPLGRREQKLTAVLNIDLDDESWKAGPSDWRDPFLPQSSGVWFTYPSLEDVFLYNGSGMMPGRTWVIAPDRETLLFRWNKLKATAPEQMNELFTPHMDGEQLGDRHVAKVLSDALPGFPFRSTSIIADVEDCIAPVLLAYRSFDRQWVIPDKRLINRPNPDLWATRSKDQIFLTALSRTSPSRGPAITASGILPDIDHYNGRGGRVFPLWLNTAATESNVKPALVAYLHQVLSIPVSPEDLFAYIAGVAANPAYTVRFQPELSTPGLRFPLSGDATLFREAAALGRRVLWLHSFGERMVDPAAGRPAGPPRVPVNPPVVPLGGRISSKPQDFPDTLDYDAAKHRLLVGHGFVENVSPAVWAYEVSGKRILTQWFSSRKLHRERPLIGDHRRPSLLSDIQPEHWLPEYTTELLNVLNVLTLLTELEPDQDSLLERICVGPLLSQHTLEAANALAAIPKPKKPQPKKSAKRNATEPQLF